MKSWQLGKCVLSLCWKEKGMVHEKGLWVTFSLWTHQITPFYLIMTILCDFPHLHSLLLWQRASYWFRQWGTVTGDPSHHCVKYHHPAFIGKFSLQVFKWLAPSHKAGICFRSVHGRSFIIFTLLGYHCEELHLDTTWVPLNCLLIIWNQSGKAEKIKSDFYIFLSQDGYTIQVHLNHSSLSPGVLADSRERLPE